MIELASPKQTLELMRKHGLRPQKRLGQNFLCDRNILNRIAASGHINAQTPVLEIGAGLGALTLTLAAQAAHVTSIEIDRHLEAPLRETTEGVENITFIFGDFLRLNLTETFDAAFGDAPGVIVANIPYYITTSIIERLIEHKTRWKRAVLLMQQEVAHRLIAAPDTKDYGAMSLFAQYNMRPEIIAKIPPTVFLPPPEITSAIVALEPIVEGAVSVDSETRMFHIIRAAFGQRRKTLLNALMRAPASFQLGLTLDTRPAAEEWLERAGLDGNRRGETLSLAEFAHLSNTFEAP